MLLYEELSNKIIRAFYNVVDYLGKGLAEKVYENALCIEFDEMGLQYERQKPLTVEYKGHIIGSYVADIIVEEKNSLRAESCYGHHGRTHCAGAELCQPDA